MPAPRQRRGRICGARTMQCPDGPRVQRARIERSCGLIRPPSRALPLDKVGGGLQRPEEMQSNGRRFRASARAAGRRRHVVLRLCAVACKRCIGCGEHPSQDVRRNWVGMGRGDSTPERRRRRCVSGGDCIIRWLTAVAVERWQIGRGGAAVCPLAQAVTLRLVQDALWRATGRYAGMFCIAHLNQL